MTHRRFALRLGPLAFELEEKAEDEPAPPSFDLDVEHEELSAIKPSLAKCAPVPAERKRTAR